MESWALGVHAGTQSNASLAPLAQSAQSPEEKEEKPDLDDCLPCHLATSSLINRGMSPAQALASFYASMGLKFEPGTTPPHTGPWPQVSCTTCHQVPSDHPASKTSLILANAAGTQSQLVSSTSELCVLCHSNPLLTEMDRQTYDVHLASERSQNQAALADYLVAHESGKTPEEVIDGKDSYDCIACHAPTSVLANGGMTEAQAIGYFFTTDSAGKFASSTSPANASEWQGLACTTCHDPHSPSGLVYFDPASKTYQKMASSDQLCGQCHGNLNVSNSNYLSYNILTGTGGVGVPDMQTMPGAACTSCHLAVGTGGTLTTDVNHGHSWAITVKNPNGSTTSSCTQCHSDMDASQAQSVVQQWQSEFSTLDTKVQKNVAAATNALDGVQDPTRQAMLKEAQHNMTYAESDESGGFHNHSYLMALLQDANQKALDLLKGGS